MERDFSTFSALFRGSEVTRKLRGKKLVNEIDSWQQTIGRNTTIFRLEGNMLLCLHFCTICPLNSTSREISFSSVIFIQTIKWLYLIWQHSVSISSHSKRARLGQIFGLLYNTLEFSEYSVVVMVSKLAHVLFCQRINKRVKSKKTNFETFRALFRRSVRVIYAQWQICMSFILFLRSFLTVELKLLGSKTQQRSKKQKVPHW